jgi:Putative multicopper oxidases
LTAPALDLHHPFHLHGYDFYVMAMDQYKAGETPDSINRRLLTENFRRSSLPAKKDTIAVPSNGWAALRFRANNPGENLTNPFPILRSNVIK